MSWSSTRARPDEIALGHCEFCDRQLNVRVMATGTFLTPFGECAACRRFTIWDEVDISIEFTGGLRLAS